MVFLLQPNIFKPLGIRWVLLEVHHIISNRCDDRGVRYTNHRDFVIDELQSCFVDLGALVLVDGLFSLQHQVVIFFIVPLGSDR